MLWLFKVHLHTIISLWGIHVLRKCSDFVDYTTTGKDNIHENVYSISLSHIVITKSITYLIIVLNWHMSHTCVILCMPPLNKMLSYLMLNIKFGVPSRLYRMHDTSETYTINVHLYFEVLQIF